MRLSKRTSAVRPAFRAWFSIVACGLVVLLSSGRAAHADEPTEPEAHPAEPGSQAEPTATPTADAAPEGSGAPRGSAEPSAAEEHVPTPPAHADGDHPVDAAPANPPAHHELYPRDPEIPDTVTTADEAELNAASGDPKRFAAILRKLVAKVRAKVVPKLEEKIERKSEVTMGRVSSALAIFSLAGVFLLLLPFFYKNRYPGKLGLLFKYSLLAAGTFVVAVNLFAAVLLVMRTAQASVASITNPQLAVIEASLDSLDENAEELAAYGPTVIEPTLQQLETGDVDEPMPVALIDNVAKLAANTQEIIPTLKKAGAFMKEMNQLSGYLPTLLSILTVVLFVLATRPVLQEIIELPARAASGEADAAKNVLKSVFARIGRELLVTILMVGVLFVVTVIAGIALSLAVRPAVEALLAYVLAAAVYIQTPEASGTTLLISLVGSMLFLAFNIAIVLIGSALFIGKVQKLLQARFHDRVPLAQHKKFALWGTLGLILVFALPTIFAFAAEPLVEGPVTGMFLKKETIEWTGFFISGPLFFVVGFLFVFWAARGLKAMVFLKKYPVGPIVPLGPPALATPAPMAVPGWDGSPRLPDAPPGPPLAAMDAPWHARGGAHPVASVEAPRPQGYPQGAYPQPPAGPPNPQQLAAAAMDFDDNAPTTLLAKNHLPPIPRKPGS